MKRDFEQWLTTFCETIYQYDTYVDFDKIYANIESIEVELNILNSLVGKQDIEERFMNLAIKYPEILKCIPILIAIRNKEVTVLDTIGTRTFVFNEKSHNLHDHVHFMKMTGLFELLRCHINKNLVDYVTGIEVGLDSNARKNRSGHLMEDLVEAHLIQEGFVKGESYFKEIYTSELQSKYGIDLSLITNSNKMEKRFDFAVKTPEHLYVFETNFYSGGGSKLNETARSYKTLALEIQDIPNVTFVWVTDGNGWISAKNNLRETFDVLDTIYNINDLRNGIFKKVLV